MQTMPRIMPSLRSAALIALTMACLGAAFLSAGCNIAAGAFYILHGPDEKISEKFKLPAERTTVIFVDDRNSRLPSRDLREMIATSAGQILLEDGAVKDLIDPRSALGAAAKDRFGEPMTIAEIGRSVGADVVIYVTVDSFNFSSDGQSVSPTSKLRVKVIDAVSEARLWPTDEDKGYALGIQSPAKQGVLNGSATEMFKVRQDAANRAGLGIAQLFTEHIARESATSGTAATQ